MKFVVYRAIKYNYIKTILSKLYEMIQCEVVCFDKNNVKFITLFKIKYAQFI